MSIAPCCRSTNHTCFSWQLSRSTSCLEQRVWLAGVSATRWWNWDGLWRSQFQHVPCAYDIHGSGLFNWCVTWTCWCGWCQSLMSAMCYVHLCTSMTACPQPLLTCWHGQTWEEITAPPTYFDLINVINCAVPLGMQSSNHSRSIP